MTTVVDKAVHGETRCLCGCQKFFGWDRGGRPSPAVAEPHKNQDAKTDPQSEVGCDIAVPQILSDEDTSKSAETRPSGNRELVAHSRPMACCDVFTSKRK